ncbi:MAG: DinB family protein [Maribacter sp.]|nr:DinB family protein [Maribacter sp.]
MTQVQKLFSKKANTLAKRITQGANTLASFAEQLSKEEWQMPVIGDGRTVGVVVHHVASVYDLEVELAKVLASGQPIKEATMEVVDQMNAEHALENTNVGKIETLALLRHKSKIAADLVRGFSDKELESSATVSLYADAPLTAQFFIEDHALRHSFHHLAKIKATINS